MNPIELVFGDCVELMKGMDGESVDAIVTDPPYGIDYKPGGKPLKDTRSETHITWGVIAGDDKPDGRWLTEAYRVLRPGSALYLMSRWDVEPVWRQILIDAGFRLVQRLTWHKRVHGKGDLKGTWATTCEDVLFASKGRHILNKRPSMLLDVGCVPTWEHRYHPHQKPVPLYTGLIENSTRPGDLVLDPFVGSGTALVACAESGRRGVGFENNAAYFASAQQRLDLCRPEPIAS